MYRGCVRAFAYTLAAETLHSGRLETPLRLLRSRTLERLVKASRERDRREILDAVRRAGADFVVVALSPSMARRLCASHAADGPHGLRAATIVDISLGFMEWRVHVRRAAAEADRAGQVGGMVRSP